MKIDEQFVMQAILELKEAQGQALGILTQALCQQLDPARLKNDLGKQIAAAQQLHSTSSLATDMSEHAVAAAEAERMLQSKPPSEGPYPKRGA